MANHFMHEIDDEKHTERIETAARKGPFKDKVGDSRIIDHSAHISYRIRGLTTEITITRGVTPQEMDVMVGKLRHHRSTIKKTQVEFRGTIREKLGLLQQLDLETVRNKVEFALMKLRQVGLFLTDKNHGGLMSGKHLHSETFKRQYY